MSNKKDNKSCHLLRKRKRTRRKRRRKTRIPSALRKAVWNHYCGKVYFDFEFKI